MRAVTLIECDNIRHIVSLQAQSSIAPICKTRGDHCFVAISYSLCTAAAAGGAKGKRVSKVAAHAKLCAEITSAGQEPDMEIIGKMTGKAAEYLSDVISKLRQTGDYEL